MASRLAGYNERRCISRDALGLYGWIAVTGRYACADTTALSGQLITALRHCLDKHAALSCVVTEIDTAIPRIVQAESVDIERHVDVLEQSNDLQRLLLDVHNYKLVHDGRHPAWRLIAQPLSAEEVYITFACSHVLMDGMSACHFHSTLLEGLNNSTSVQVGALPPPPPALDKATDWPISWSFLLRPLLGELLPDWLTRATGITKEQTYWHGSTIRPSLPEEYVTTDVHLVSLSSEELASTLQLCRQHNCKLTALLNVLFSQALSEELLAHGQDHKDFLIEVPFDLRRCIPGTETLMANYVSAVEVLVDASEQNIWSAAGRDTQLIKQASTTTQDQPVALLKFLSDFNDWVRRRACQTATASFSTSNLGSLSPAHGEWSLREMVFSQSGDATGAPLNVNVASVKGGSLWITLTWWPGMLGVTDESAFVSNVCAKLLQKVKELR